jgi:hypothetical protein
MGLAVVVAKGVGDRFATIPAFVSWAAAPLESVAPGACTCMGRSNADPSTEPSDGV